MNYPRHTYALVFYLFTFILTAVESVSVDCNSRLVGWASVPAPSSTIGGGSVEPHYIETLQDLHSYASLPAPKVLIITRNITTSHFPVDIASHKTIVGAHPNITIFGGLNIRAGSSNIIIRNLNIQGAWPNRGPDDTIAARGAHYLWFDHLNIRDAGDGLMDLTLGSDYITVSYCKFWYSNKENKHRFASLVSSGADHDDTDVGKLRVTFHHNWFAELVDQRMPRILYGQGHIFNNFYSSNSNLYAIGVESLGSALIENNYFENVNSPHRFMYNRTSYITATGNIYIITTGDHATGRGGQDPVDVTPFTAPPYVYTADPAIVVPSHVQKCAGPQLTLEVT